MVDVAADVVKNGEQLMSGGMAGGAISLALMNLIIKGR